VRHQLNEKYGQKVYRRRSGTVDTDSKMISRCEQAFMQDFYTGECQRMDRGFEQLNDVFLENDFQIRDVQHSLGE
jgi:hypothetical protein